MHTYIKTCVHTFMTTDNGSMHLSVSVSLSMDINRGESVTSSVRRCFLQNPLLYTSPLITTWSIIRAHNQHVSPKHISIGFRRTPHVRVCASISLYLCAFILYMHMHAADRVLRGGGTGGEKSKPNLIYLLSFNQERAPRHRIIAHAGTTGTGTSTCGDNITNNDLWGGTSADNGTIIDIGIGTGADTGIGTGTDASISSRDGRVGWCRRIHTHQTKHRVQVNLFTMHGPESDVTRDH